MQVFFCTTKSTKSTKRLMPFLSFVSFVLFVVKCNERTCKHALEKKWDLHPQGLSSRLKPIADNRTESAMALLGSSILLVVGFVLLIKGAGSVVSGASEIARRLEVSDLVIGLTVVAFGTSLPELFVNVTASVKGSTGITLGNVLGSNIANILLILGMSALVCPLHVPRGTVWREIPFSLLAALALGFLANDRLIDGWAYSDVSRADGLVFLLFFAIFLYYSAAIARSEEAARAFAPAASRPLRLSVISLAGGMAALGVGGHWIVESGTQIGQALGMSEAVVGLTFVAVGTSLPELATSVMAAWRKNMEIAVGNVVGSNIFNIFFVLGVSALIRPLPFHQTVNLDIGMVIVASLILFMTMFTGRRQALDRWEGALLLGLYAGYLLFRILQ